MANPNAVKITCSSVIACIYLYLMIASCQPLATDEIGPIIGGSNWSQANSVAGTYDGGYILVGTARSNGPGSDNIWIVKTDDKGDAKWNRSLGSSGSDSGLYVSQTPEGGYLVVGSTESDDHGSDIRLIKTNDTGYEEWNNRNLTEGEGSSKIISVERVFDDSYLILYERSISDSSSVEVRMIKIEASSDGDTTWNIPINLSQRNSAIGLLPSEGEDSQVLYIDDPLDGDGPKIITLNVDPHGNVSRIRVLREGIKGTLLDAEATDGGAYVLLASNRSISSSDINTFLINISGEGDEVWNKRLGGQGHYVGRSMIRTEDGGYLVVGETGALGNGSSDLWLQKVDSSGEADENLSLVMGGSGYDTGRAVIPTDDGGYLVSGATGSFGGLPLNAWLVKVSSAGVEEWNKTYSIQNLRTVGSVGEETFAERLNSTAADKDEHYVDPLLNVTLFIIKIIISIIGLIILFIALFKIGSELYKILIKRQLVLQDIVDGYGDDSLKSSNLMGLSEQLRESLHDDLKWIWRVLDDQSKEFELSGNGGSKFIFVPTMDGNVPSNILYVPTEIDVTPLKDLTDSLKEGAPSQVKPFVSLLSFIFPKHKGQKVTCTLQGHKDMPEAQGITAKIADLRDANKLSVVTFWEKAKKDDAKKCSSKSEAEALNEIVDLLKNMKLYSDALKYRKEAIICRGLDEKGEALKDEDLEELSKKQTGVDRSRTYFKIAEKALKEKGSDDADKYYNKSLEVIPHDKSDLRFSSPFSPSYCERGEIYEDEGMIDEALTSYNRAKLNGEEEASENIRRLKLQRSEKLREVGLKFQKMGRYSDAKTYLQDALKLSPNDAEAKNSLNQVEVELAKEKKPYTRYRELIKPVSWWLAVEIAREVLIKSTPQEDAFKNTVSKHRARVHLFCGTLLMSYPQIDKFPVFMKLAKSDFDMAKKCDGEWWRPYVVTGDLHMERGRTNSSDKSPFKSAIIEYQMGEKKIDVCIEGSEECRAKHYIQVNKSMAKYLSGDINGARENLRTLIKLKGSNTDIKSESTDTDIKSELTDDDIIGYLKEAKSSKALYNLACLMGLAMSKYPEVDDKNNLITSKSSIQGWAKKCLIYSLAHSLDDKKGPWLRADNDPDLKDVITKEEISDIKYYLESESMSNKSLDELVQSCLRLLGLE